MANNSRDWFHYPILMPLNADGDGPASLDEIAELSWQVWDKTMETHGSFDNLYDAINAAMRLNAARHADETLKADPRDNDAIWARFYRDGKTLAEIAAEFGGSIYDYSPWLYRGAMK